MEVMSLVDFEGAKERRVKFTERLPESKIKIEERSLENAHRIRFSSPHASQNAGTKKINRKTRAIIKAALLLLFINLGAMAGVFIFILQEQNGKTSAIPFCESSKEEGMALESFSYSHIFKVADYDSLGTLVDSENAPTRLPFTSPVRFRLYTVKAGDTIGGITKKMRLRNISTLIGMNNIKNVRRLAAGDTLTVPSIDGLKVKVSKGDTLESLAKKYSIKVEELADVNEVESNVLAVGSFLFIPGKTLSRHELRMALGTLFCYPILTPFVVSSPFGPRKDPFTGRKGFHHGVDMACMEGTAVHAAAEGVVARVGFSSLYGNFIIVKHENNSQTLYAHLKKALVKNGRQVASGETIGLVGSTGRATGAHLHFSIYKNGKPVDPLKVLKNQEL